MPVPLARKTRLENTRFLLTQKTKNKVSSNKGQKYLRQVLTKISCAYTTEEFPTQLFSYHPVIIFIKFYKLTLSETSRTVNINNAF